MGLAIFLFVAITLASSCHAGLEFAANNPIRQRVSHPDLAKINCQSFRLGVEANNIRDFEMVPDYCIKYIKSYLTGKQYNLDIEGVVIQALEFAKTTPIPKDLRTNVWVFDLDETLLSNLDFFKSSDWGLPVNSTALFEWIASKNATAPTFPAVKELYDTVLELGFKIVIISESPESLSTARISHLKKAGYDNWDTLIFRGNDENELTNSEFRAKKVRELVLSEGRYRVISTVGDQWTDLNIPHALAGRRTFKLPNPIYYVK